MDKSQIKKEVASISREGYLFKQSRIVKSWRQRWVVLTTNFLFTFKQQRSYEKPTEIIPIKQITIMKSCEEHPRPHTFKVQTSQNVFYFAAESPGQRQQWLAAVGKAVVKTSKKYNDDD